MKPKVHKILVIPGGGAAGILSSTILAELERDTATPAHQLFDEIWCSSIGSVIAALLTTSKKSGVLPMSAAEITEYLEHTFSNFARGIGILSRIKKQVASSILLRDTLIPLRILSAEVVRFYSIWPSETKLRSFTSVGDGEVSLASAVASSCTVFPIHPRAERVRYLDGRIVHCIDAGCEVCTESCMNPLDEHFREFTNGIDPFSTSLTSIAIYFVSNGWVRLEKGWSGSGSAERQGRQGSSFDVLVYNIDADLRSVFQAWRKDTRAGALLGQVKNTRFLYNLVGAGALPASYLKAAAVRVAQKSGSYKDMLESLCKRT